MNWTVEGALDEVIASVRDGAEPFCVEDSTADGLKSRYRPDFQSKYDEQADWNADKQRILPLAVLVGAYASLLTIAKHAGHDLPECVDPEMTYLAGYHVAKAVCPAFAPGPRGGYCGDYGYPIVPLEGEEKLGPALAKIQGAYLAR